ncbi:MAG: hypothetical protein WD826_02355, partial [Actinomycetota bacterium]
MERIASDGIAFTRIGALSGDAVGALVGDIVGAVPGPNLSMEVERASGNPFYILELVAAFQEAGAVELTDGVAELVRPALPPSIKVTVLRRIATLPPDTVDVLRSCAMLGSSFTLRDLAISTGREARDLMHALAPALGAGFLREIGGREIGGREIGGREIDERLAFRHDLVRAALYEDVPATVRRAVHRAIGSAFASADYPTASVATHMGLGADVGDEEAIEWLLRAADEVSWKDFFIHADLLRRAEGLCLPNDARLQLVRGRLAGALGMTGHGEEAVAIATDVLAGAPDAEVETETRFGFGHALRLLGRPDEAVEQFMHVAASPLTDSGHRAAALADIASVRFVQGDLASARLSASEAITIPLTDNWHGATLGHMILSYLADAEGDVRSALDHGLDAVRWSDREFETGRGVTTARVPVAMALFAADRHTEAFEQLHIGHQRRGDVGIEDAQIYEHALRGFRYMIGDWDEALGSPSDVLEDASPGILASFAVRSMIRQHRGDFDAARSEVERG